MTKKTSTRYASEVRERAVRMGSNVTVRLPAANGLAVALREAGPGGRRRGLHLPCPCGVYPNQTCRETHGCVSLGLP